MKAMQKSKKSAVSRAAGDLKRQSSRRQKGLLSISSTQTFCCRTPTKPGANHSWLQPATICRGTHAPVQRQGRSNVRGRYRTDTSRGRPIPAKLVLRNVPDRNVVGHILPDHDGLAKTIPVTLTKSQADSCSFNFRHLHFRSIQRVTCSDRSSGRFVSFRKIMCTDASCSFRCT